MLRSGQVGFTVSLTVKYPFFFDDFPKCSYKLYYSVTRSSMSAQISFQGKSQKIIFTNNFIVAHKNKISQLLWIHLFSWKTT